MITMGAMEKETGPGGIERRVGAGIRLKLFGFLLPLVFLLIVTVTWVVTEVTKSTLRHDLLQRGAAISRVVALSAGHSLLSNDPLGLDRLVSETKASDPDIAFVAIRDASDIVVAHDRVSERGEPYRPVPPCFRSERSATRGRTRWCAADGVSSNTPPRSPSRDGAWGSPPSGSPWKVSRPRSGRSGS